MPKTSYCGLPLSDFLALSHDSIIMCSNRVGHHNIWVRPRFNDDQVRVLIKKYPCNLKHYKLISINNMGDISCPG